MCIRDRFETVSKEPGNYTGHDTEMRTPKLEETQGINNFENDPDIKSVNNAASMLENEHWSRTISEGVNDPGFNPDTLDNGEVPDLDLSHDTNQAVNQTPDIEFKASQVVAVGDPAHEVSQSKIIDPPTQPLHPPEEPVFERTVTESDWINAPDPPEPIFERAVTESDWINAPDPPANNVEFVAQDQTITDRSNNKDLIHNGAISSPVTTIKSSTDPTSISTGRKSFVTSTGQKVPPLTNLGAITSPKSPKRNATDNKKPKTINGKPTPTPITTKTPQAIKKTSNNVGTTQKSSLKPSGSHNNALIGAKPSGSASSLKTPRRQTDALVNNNNDSSPNVTAFAEAVTMSGLKITPVKSTIVSAEDELKRQKRRIEKALKISANPTPRSVLQDSQSNKSSKGLFSAGTGSLLSSPDFVRESSKSFINRAIEDLHFNKTPSPSEDVRKRRLISPSPGRGHKSLNNSLIDNSLGYQNNPLNKSRDHSFVLKSHIEMDLEEAVQALSLKSLRICRGLTKPPKLVETTYFALACFFGDTIQGLSRAFILSDDKDWKTLMEISTLPDKIWRQLTTIKSTCALLIKEECVEETLKLLEKIKDLPAEAMCQEFLEFCTNVIAFLKAAIEYWDAVTNGEIAAPSGNDEEEERLKNKKSYSALSVKTFGPPPRVPGKPISTLPEEPKRAEKPKKPRPGAFFNNMNNFTNGRTQSGASTPRHSNRINAHKKTIEVDEKFDLGAVKEHNKSLYEEVSKYERELKDLKKRSTRANLDHEREEKRRIAEESRVKFTEELKTSFEMDKSFKEKVEHQKKLKKKIEHERFLEELNVMRDKKKQMMDKRLEELMEKQKQYENERKWREKVAKEKEEEKKKQLKERQEKMSEIREQKKLSQMWNRDKEEYLLEKSREKELERARKKMQEEKSILEKSFEVYERVKSRHASVIQTSSPRAGDGTAQMTNRASVTRQVIMIVLYLECQMYNNSG
eukprot:TRINITY_DN4039_c0_g2_i6.p1 TRINITY_DN4039_c0_g2~~TRINITY_DN4039_c0_g2_i6.p1  ORF type:complete len:1006 (+),score=132.56 TRINITY_DN4039_c0_g2_i6:101-3019(+)